MSHEIEDVLKNAGFHDQDIKLAQKLTRRGLESHLNLTHNIRTCESCALSLECYGQSETAPFVTTERVTGSGPWNSPLMIVADMPGEHEGKYKTPFLGPEGQLLTMILAKAGIDRNAVYMTYAVKCAGTRQPSQSELHECKKHFYNELEAVNPAVVLAVGDYAKEMVDTEDQKFVFFHTHSMRRLLGGENIQKYKAEVWNDISLAVKRVKELKPYYTYDRVGLTNL